MTPALFWLRRIGFIGVFMAAGAVVAYVVGQVLDLFAYNTQVVIAAALTLLLVFSVVWMASSALMDAVDVVRATSDDIDVQREDLRELLTYARELLEIVRAEWVDADELEVNHTSAPAERASTAVMKTANPATDEAPATNVVGGIRVPPRPAEAKKQVSSERTAGEELDIEEWARREVSAMWSKPTAELPTGPVPKQDTARPSFIEPTPNRSTPAKRTASRKKDTSDRPAREADG